MKNSNSGIMHCIFILIFLSCSCVHDPRAKQSNDRITDSLSTAEAEQYALEFDRICFPLFLESLQAIKIQDDRLLYDFIDHYPHVRVIQNQQDPVEVNSWEKFPVSFDIRIFQTGSAIVFPIQWNDTVKKDLTWQLYFQTLNWVLPFLKSEDQDSLMTGFRIVNDWILAHCNYPVPDERLAFNDHATSERMIVLYHAYTRYKQKNMIMPQFEKCLLLSLLGHIFFCGSLEKYNSSTNHGIIMDISLIKLLTDFQSFTKRDDFLQLAYSRVWESYRKSFTAEGVHKEHSPCYHSWIANNLNDLILTADSMNIMVPDELRIVRDKAIEYTDQLQINGYFPTIGDCSCNKRNTFAKLTPPEENGLDIYPLSGWAFIRDSMNKSTVIIQSDFFSTVHYQQDETSFILNVDGYDLIIDPGLFNYTPGAEFNTYMRSAFAHNVTVIDNMEFNPDTANTGLSGITRYYSEANNNGSACGIIELVHPHYRQKGVEIYRQFAFLGNNSYVVNDEIHSDSVHEYCQLFHLAPNAIIKKNKESLTITWPEHHYILNIYSNFTDFLIIEGEKEPLQGWYFPEFNNAAPAPSLIIKTKEKDLNFTTRLYVSNSNEIPLNFPKTDSLFLLKLHQLERIERTELKHQPVSHRWRPAREKQNVNIHR